MQVLKMPAVFSPGLERNIDPVKPQADHLGIDITLTPPISMPRVGKISNEILTQHAGKVVVWVGNVSGNLQAIYRRLGGKGRGPLGSAFEWNLLGRTPRHHRGPA